MSQYYSTRYTFYYTGDKVRRYWRIDKYSNDKKTPIRKADLTNLIGVGIRDLSRLPKAPKVKKPKYADLITKAITECGHGQPKITSRQAITKYIEVNRQGYDKTQLKLALKREIANGHIIQVKGSYKLSPAYKKELKKANN
jgi:hypothetical protein